MLRREVLDRIGGFDEAMPACEDYDLWLRLTAAYPVQFLEEALIVKYGGHGDQLSQRYWGMDRFRVYALEKMLAGHALQGEAQRQVLAMLVEKCGILETGYRNRNKPEQADRFNAARAHYAGCLASQNGMIAQPFLGKESLLNVETD